MIEALRLLLAELALTHYQVPGQQTAGGTTMSRASLVGDMSVGIAGTSIVRLSSERCSWSAEACCSTGALLRRSDTGAALLGTACALPAASCMRCWCCTCSECSGALSARRGLQRHLHDADVPPGICHNTLIHPHAEMASSLVPCQAALARRLFMGSPPLPGRCRSFSLCSAKARGCNVTLCLLTLTPLLKAC